MLGPPSMLLPVKFVRDMSQSVDGVVVPFVLVPRPSWPVPPGCSDSKDVRRSSSWLPRPQPRLVSKLKLKRQYQ